MTDLPHALRRIAHCCFVAVCCYFLWPWLKLALLVVAAIAFLTLAGLFTYLVFQEHPRHD